jgi:hypothetical protein
MIALGQPGGTPAPCRPVRAPGPPGLRDRAAGAVLRLPENRNRSPIHLCGAALHAGLGSHVNIPLYSVPVSRVEPPRIVERFSRTYVVPPMVQARCLLLAHSAFRWRSAAPPASRPSNRMEITRDLSAPEFAAGAWPFASSISEMPRPIDRRSSDSTRSFADEHLCVTPFFRILLVS